MKDFLYKITVYGRQVGSCLATRNVTSEYMDFLITRPGAGLWSVDHVPTGTRVCVVEGFEAARKIAGVLSECGWVDIDTVDTADVSAGLPDDFKKWIRECYAQMAWTEPPAPEVTK